MARARMKIAWAELSDVGHRRERNEDSMVSLPEYGVFCVADGMGGASDGHEASRQIVLSVEAGVRTAEETPLPEVVCDSIQEANKAIFQVALSRNTLGMGSTAVAIVLNQETWEAHVFHAGDSRAYRLKKKRLHRLTADHTVAAEIGLDTEGRAPTFLDSMLTRAVGLGDEVEIVSDTFPVGPGDVFLLCSDGLNRHIQDKEVEQMLGKYPKKSVDTLATELVETTKERGAIDNVTVIVVALEEADDNA